MLRREFLGLLATGLASNLLSACQATDFESAFDGLESTLLEPILDDVTRTWLGASFWANRLQDWRVSSGQIECLRGESDFEMRTVSILTRIIEPNGQGVRLTATLENLVPSGAGIGGFLIGIGNGELDHRKCALVQRVAAPGGGMLLTVDETGRPAFRRFDHDETPLEYAEIPANAQTGGAGGGAYTGSVLFECLITPNERGAYDILLTTASAQTGEALGSVLMQDVEGHSIAGGVSLASSPTKGSETGARWAFRDIAMGGGDVSVHPERALGPVMGCLHSLNETTLKMTVQMLPVSEQAPMRVRLDYRSPSQAAWRNGPEAFVGDGFAALLRHDEWDPSQTWQYRIVDVAKPETAMFNGEIRKDPGNERDLAIALHSCLLPTARSLDTPTYREGIPQERKIPRYSNDNILFPHSQLVANCDSHRPDLYVFLGDQYYETYPTRYGRETADAKLDTLYRWYLWLWTFRDVLAHTPCILLADDHDILQGNLWGQAGEDSELPTEEDGGFKWSPDVVKMVYRIQCGHNPDSFDPTPIRFEIPVVYGSFVYGGTSFAFVEDRKFKIAPDYETPPVETRGDLLGERQEVFLKAWANMHPGLPKVCLTASIWGAPQTGPDLAPLLDYDANGYPSDGRMRAVKLLRDANAIALAGDQHLGLVARQGVDSFEDGPVFFAGPAGAAFWQRWFEGNGQLDNSHNGDPNTGNFTDTFDNPMRILAVANPKLTHAEFEEGNQSWGKFLYDNQLKTEGYGIVKVQHAKDTFVFECWPWDAKPEPGAQFSGWPFEVAFADAGQKR